MTGTKKNDIEKLREEFFKLTDLRKPMVKKWYYEGYYEDFSWNYHWEDCSEVLKRNNITLEEYNKKIQNAKKKAKELDKKDKSHIYDYFTDSVETNAGRIGRAEWHYPIINDKILLNLLCLLSSDVYQKIELSVYDIDELQELILQEFVDVLKSKYTKESKKKKIKQSIGTIFERKERREW